MKKEIPENTNRLMFVLLMFLHGLVFFALPTLLIKSTFWGLILVPMAWLNIVHWGLIHEAIHKILFRNPRTNEIGGRMLGIAMGASFNILRFGHLMHHQLNRTFHSEQVGKRTVGAKIYYYCHLLFGLYLSEVIPGWMFLLIPRRQFMVVARATFLHNEEPVAVAGERFFYERGNIRPTRIDVTIITLLYGSAFYVYGAMWPWLVAFIGIRAMVISFMDNIYHFDTPVDNSKPAKELKLPRRLSALILFGNYHETHHANPNVPWPALPDVHAREARGFDGNFFTHGLKQFEGPGLRTG